jgi:uncharacterized protein (DUF927 family)
MKGLGEFLSEDSNQFGPGTDLIISLLAILLVMTMISSHLYNLEKKDNDARKVREKGWNEQKDKGGNFELASEYFPAGDFYLRPVTKLVDPQKTTQKIRLIIEDYKRLSKQFKYIFVIGHSNNVDDPNAEDKSYAARLQRNWEYAGRRAGVIAALLQEHLTDEQKDRLVVITTGEFDMKVPTEPNSQENAYVEVVFGKEWKPLLRK